MKRKLQNITSKAYSVAAIVVLLFVWQILSSAGIVPSFLLPSPLEVVQAFVKDFPLLMEHAKVTLTEGFLGLTLGVVIGFVAAVLMDHFQGFYKAFYPIMVITQTIPTIAIAPLLVLWMGYEMAPKVTLIVIVTFFPIAIGLLEGFQSADGVYMTRVRKSYAFDKMFAVIFLISAISLLLMWLVSILQKKCMPWEK